MKDTILVVEFGGQLTQLIVRRLRELEVRAILVKPEDAYDDHTSIAGVILSGGPKSVNEEDAAHVRRIQTWKLPILGICYGHQLLAFASGGEVIQQGKREYGRELLGMRPQAKSLILTSSADTGEQVWMSHGDSVSRLPDGWVITGCTASCPCAAIENHEKKQFGVQFHPESTHTARGRELLRRFAVEICRARQVYTQASLVQELKDSIRRAVGESGHILIACSLGVDSTTVAKLCQDALGPDRIHPCMVNMGLLRQEDFDLVEMGRKFLPTLNIVDAEDECIASLVGVADPEQKRYIIGTTFWNVFKHEANRLGATHPIRAYTQGTISPDVIESGGSSERTAVIKSHHNLVKRPDDFPFTPFEPLRDFWLFKDQVRAVAQEIGVPPEFYQRHPFPGPGLAVRVSGEFSRERLEIARAADAIFIEELHHANLYHSIAQAGATVLSDKSVCQQGDGRHYGWTVMLWAYQTEDFMTADVVRLPSELLHHVAARISREVHGVGRVGFNYTTKPPGTIEWE